MELTNETQEVRHAQRRVKLFISSTFRDMNSERDYLADYIYPRLEEYCKNRYIDFFPIDLRWGITEEDSRNGLVLTACMEEVDSSRPFFVGILGECYGSSPTLKDLNSLRPSVEKERTWLESEIAQGTSITEIEMQYAVLRDMEISHACFFFRDSNTAESKLYYESNIQTRTKLNSLKSKIRNQNQYPVFDYSEAKELGDRLYEEVVKMIEKEYPVGEEVNSRLQNIYRQDFAFKQKENLCDYSLTRDWIEDSLKKGKRITQIRGNEGCGTSTLLVSYLNYIKSKHNYKTLYFDFEAVQQGVDSISALKDYFEYPEINLQKVSKAVVGIDNTASLTIDEVNSLQKWMESFHEGILFFVVTTNGTLCEISFSYNGYPYDIIHDALLPQMVEEYAQGYVAKYGKRLTKSQIETIKAEKKLHNPTDLKLFLNTLINFGNFEKLEEEIKRLVKASSYSIFWELLDEGWKLFSNINLGLQYMKVTTALSLVTCGISEKDLIESTNITRGEWAIMRPYIIQFCKGSVNGLRYKLTIWNQHTKNLFDTRFRVKQAYEIIKWFLAEPNRYSRAGRHIAAIYSDIWIMPYPDEWDVPLPLDEFFTADSLKEIIRSMLLSIDVAVHMNIGDLTFLWGRIVDTHNGNRVYFSDKPKFVYGTSLDEANHIRLLKFYQNLATVAQSLCRGKDAAWAYQQMASIMSNDKKRNEYYKSLKKTTLWYTGRRRLHEEMRIAEIINEVEKKNPLLFLAQASLQLGRTREARKYLSKIEKDVSNYIKSKISQIKIQSYIMELDWKSMVDEEYRCANLLTDKDVYDFEDILLDIEGNILYSMTFGLQSPDQRETAIKLQNKIASLPNGSPLVSNFSYYNNLSSAFLVCNSLRCDYNKMFKFAYWAGQISRLLYGTNSYQCSRATILYSYAKFKIEGTRKNLPCTNMICEFNSGNYDRILDPNIEWEEIDYNVRLAIFCEHVIFYRLNYYLQPDDVKTKMLPDDSDDFAKLLKLDKHIRFKLLRFNDKYLRYLYKFKLE